MRVCAVTWKGLAGPVKQPSNYAFERTGQASGLARARRAFHCAPSARLKALRPAAQRER